MEKSFTFYHWNLIERLENHEISIDNLSRSVIEELCLVILPDGNTLMHKLNGDFEVISYIYKTSALNDLALK